MLDKVRKLNSKPVLLLSNQVNREMDPEIDPPISPLLPCISEDENEATISSSESEADNATSAFPTTTATPEWKGNWKRQLEARDLKRKERKENKERKSRIATGPPIPEMRFEEGVLLSIRRFLHLKSQPIASDSSRNIQKDGKPVEVIQKKEASWNEIFLNPIEVEWSKVAYVLFRDQVVFQVLTGFGFAVGAMWLGSAARAWRGRP